MRNKKLQVWLPLIFSVVMVIGMFFGYQLSDQSGGKGFWQMEKRTSLQEAVDLIKLKYVDPVSMDSLQNRAIEDMMTRLDPHSVFLPPVELKEANEDLAGNFEGIGVEFNVFDDTVNVVYVIPNGPSDKAGLQIGDKILKVNDSSLTTKVFQTEQIKKMIRGVAGSDVIIQIVRDHQQREITITRRAIPVPSIDAAYMMDQHIGYIKLNRFAESSYKEFMQAMEDLQKKGMQKLIFDLRGNGGGFMNEAVNMADEFLDDEKLIVYTEGMHSPKREYHCRRNGLFEKGKLVILVDEFTASASEVLSGCLQDWDRAIIIGRRTFGKGLVQEQYDLSDGSAIRLTVARYYTPLGRSIQRPYEKGKKIYMDELWNRYSDGELVNADSNKVNRGPAFRTHSGKLVYGGGGIMPDIFVPLDTSSYQKHLNKLFVDGSFNGFVYNFYLKHKELLNQFSSEADYLDRYEPGNGVWRDLANYAAKDSLHLETVYENEKDYLTQRFKAFLARYRWWNEGFYVVLNKDDTAIQKAVEELAK